MRDLHSQPDGSHTHLRAVPSALQHTGRDVAHAPGHPVLSPSLLGSRQDPTQGLLMGRICTSFLKSAQAQPEQRDGTAGTRRITRTCPCLTTNDD